MDKNILRKEMLSKRAEFFDKSEKFNQNIIKNVINYDEYKNCNVLLSYVSKDDEINTHTLIQTALDSGKSVAVPKVIGNELEFYFINSFSELFPGCFGVLEPKGEGSPLKDFTDALCIVPALAVNKEGYRIGYGKGFYDRFLKNKLTLKTAVLCYSLGIIDFIPSDFDIPIKIIITEKGMTYVTRN